MILLIDNYDSFSYNLYQYIGCINENIKVIKNDEMTVNEIIDLKPSHIIISPGPGFPNQAGIIVDLVKKIKNIPILGVCLGHQAICEAFGAEIVHAKEIMHGKKDLIKIDNSNRLFHELNDNVTVARYHSLIARDLPDCLKVIGEDKYNEVMAVSHNKYPIYGVQFHPESIMTQCGMQILKNFLEIEG